MDKRQQETITKYLGDLHALESHGLKAISRQADQLKGEGHPEALAAVQDFRSTLQSLVSSLEIRMQALGGSPTSPVKEAASTLAGVAAGLYNAVRTEEASKSIRDDYTFLSHSAIAYLMLAITAKAFDDHDTEELAEEGYRQMARCVMLIDRVMPGLVVSELRQDGLPVQDVSDWAQTFIGNAWSRQGTAVGAR